MKEAPIFRAQQSELTRPSASPRLDSGGTIFMSNTPGVGEGLSAVAEKPAPTTIKPVSEAQVRTARQDPERVLGGSDAWQQALRDQGYSEREIHDPATQEAIEIAQKAGIAPKLREKVLANARLEDSDRLAGARKVLQELAGGKPLTEAQEKALEPGGALLKAHEIGADEVGKDGGEAGVYNYTKGQLHRKTEVLKEAGFSKEERRALIEAGLVGKISTAGITDPALSFIVNQYNNLVDKTESRTGDNHIGTREVDRYIERIQNLVDDLTRGVDKAQASDLMDRLIEQRFEEQSREAEVRSRGRGEQDISYFKLSQADQDTLRTGNKDEIEAWVNKHFNVLYRAAAESGKDPQEIKYFKELEAAITDAERFLRGSIEKSALIRNISDTRQDNMMLTGVIGGRDTERMKGVAQLVGAHSVLLGYHLDKRQASTLAHRAEELLEDKRLQEFNNGGEPWKRGHVMPKMLEELRKDLIAEQLALAKQGAGDFGKYWGTAALELAKKTVELEEKTSYSEEYQELNLLSGHLTKDQMTERIREMALQDEVTRVVSLGLNLLKNTQREAVVAARGHEPFGIDSYFTSAGASFKSFNPETFFTDKWDLVNEEERQIHADIVKAGMVKDWMLENNVKLNTEQQRFLGDLLFINMSVAADFASSGWRIKGDLQAMEDYFAHRIALQRTRARTDGGITMVKDLSKEDLGKARERAKEFGLFMRYKANLGDEFGSRNEALMKLVHYRPEEVIHLVRLRWPEDIGMTDKLHKMYSEVFAANRGDFVHVADYDSFKKEFGFALRVIREQQLREDDPMQVDFTHMQATDGEREISIQNDLHEILKAKYQADGLDEASAASRAQEGVRVIQHTFRSMQNYIQKNLVTIHDNKIKYNHFDKNYLFVDIKERLLATDDNLFDRLENPVFTSDDEKEKKVFSDWTPLSKRWSPDPAGDGLVRNFGDIDDGEKAIESYVAFIKATKMQDKQKAAIEAAEKWASINGQDTRAKVIRHTIIEYMAANSLPVLADVLGIRNFPFELPITKAQKILGPHAQPMSQDERRIMFNELRQYLVGAVNTRREMYLAEIEKVKASHHSPEEKAKEIRKLQGEIKEAEEHAKHFEHAAARALLVRPWDMVKQRSTGFFFALIIFALAEAGHVADEAMEGAGVGGGGGHH